MRRRPPGVSVVEALIVCALFSVFGLIMFWLLRVGTDSSRKHEATSDTYRQCLIALEHIRQELRGARLLSPTRGNTESSAVYTRPSLDPGGGLRVDSQGQPQWLPPSTLAVSPAGKLQREDGQTRVLADLGTSGSLRFTRLADQLLEVEVRARAEVASQKAEDRVTARMSLAP